MQHQHKDDYEHDRVGRDVFGVAETGKGNGALPVSIPVTFRFRHFPGRDLALPRIPSDPLTALRFYTTFDAKAGFFACVP